MSLQQGHFGEPTGPVDNVPSDAPLGGNRKCTERGVPAQRAGCCTAVRLAVHNEANLVGRSLPCGPLFLSQRPIHSVLSLESLEMPKTK
jgi:hypothetical protein